MRFVIVTGMSGAGKSTALRMLEDAGYFCIDNLPILLIPKLADLLLMPNSEINKIALGIDVRNGDALKEIAKTLENLEQSSLEYQILFLEANNRVLVKRYKETRRNHPLSKEGRVDEGISEERVRLWFLKQKADYIIDTSQLLTRELKEEINKIFVKNKEFKNLYVTVLSFGFKYGIPNDADLVFDVRFLPNPYYIEELRPLSGNNAAVHDYVMANEKSYEFLEKLTDMMKFLIPNYIQEGKHQLVVAIGCTGGKHRSVTLANELYRTLACEEEYGIRIEHRDIEKDGITKAN
ncbi:MAG: RNase adapter RapZ [Lachnospiraceae bacterium]|nr:RNase adapter RapZ [Lachnospiraceae bacterium]